MKNKSGWYHDASNSHDTEIKYFEVDPWTLNNYENYWAGPFRTFGEAKKDAIEFFKTDIAEARYSIQCLRALRKTK